MIFKISKILLAFLVFISITEFPFAKSFEAVTILSHEDKCRCVHPSHCADGGGAIKPRQDNLTKGAVVCENGERYCCVIVTPTPTLPPLPHCGQQRTTYVPGFHPDSDRTRFGEFPWLVRILNHKGDFLGSGALISESTIITVAHIFENSYPASVVVGEWNDAIDVRPHKPIEIHVRKDGLKIHHHYNSVNLQNDIALIQLESPVDLRNGNPQIGTVCLPSTSFEERSERCFLSTFGNNELPIMKKVDLPILPPSHCEHRLKDTVLGRSFILDSYSFLCAGGEPGKDACKGEGGAPLVCKVNGHYQLAGLVSWGLTDDDCRNKGIFPGVYVNVLSYRDWIEKHAF